MKVIVLVGIPGSGKSTWAQKNYPNKPVCSADHFFMKPHYQFDPRLLPIAHNECLRKFVELVSGCNGIQDMVIVDNTNTTIAEIAPYAALALAYGHELKICVFMCDPQVATRNIHGVSVSALTKMAMRLTDTIAHFAPWWDVQWMPME